MRLDKYIADVSELTRSQVKKAIKNGDVRVNDTVASTPTLKVTEDDTVYLYDEELRSPEPRYFMLNKPQGYVCAAKDRQHMTVMELIEEPNKERLHIAGRLDIDTTGLVLISDDGKWTHRVTSPAHHCKKTYYVETRDPLPDHLEESFEKGIWLAKEKIRTKPAKVERVHEQALYLTITEGKFHQVKRMFHAVDNEVELLHRQQVAGIVLDNDLEEGEYRELTTDEIHSL